LSSGAVGFYEVSLKVLHLPYNIGGNPLHLSKGERELGLDSQTLTLGAHKFGYQSDRSLNIDELSKWQRLFKTGTEFLELRNQYDVFNFNFGSSLMNFPSKGMAHFELPFYPRSKKLFAVYQGCDARQKYPTMMRTKIAACHNPTCYAGQCNSGELDEQRRRGIDKMAEYVEHMWALNPDLLYFLPTEKSSFLPYAVSPPQVEKNKLTSHDREFTVVHAPTNRAAKGSDIILATLSKLQQAYPKRLKVLLVENMPYDEALAIYRTADLIIDQVLIGWYGAFAVECMYMGKPVVARIASEDLHFVPSEMSKQLQVSLINSDPQNLEQILRDLIENPHQLQVYAENARGYAHRWHLPSQVAKVTKEFYER